MKRSCRLCQWQEMQGQLPVTAFLTSTDCRTQACYLFVNRMTVCKHWLYCKTGRKLPFGPTCHSNLLVPVLEMCCTCEYQKVWVVLGVYSLCPLNLYIHARAHALVVQSGQNRTRHINPKPALQELHIWACRYLGMSLRVSQSLAHQTNDPQQKAGWI